MVHDIAAIGIPSFLVLVGILLNQRGHDKLEARINQVEAKIDKVEDRLETKIEAVRREMGAKIDLLQHETGAKIDVLQHGLRDFYRVLGQHDKAIEILEKKD